jgi:inner membrane protein
MAGISLFQSSTAKLLGIGFLALLMGIPLGMVSGLRHEREMRRSEAESTTAESWGSATRVAGPVLAVPHLRVKIDKDVRSEIWTWWYLLPEQLDVDAGIEVSERRKGIFALPVYLAEISLKGRFGAARAALPQSEGEYRWEQAVVLLPVPDPRGLRRLETRIADDVTIRLTPSTHRIAEMTAFSTMALKLDAEQPLEFAFSLSQAGTRHLEFLPMARTYRATLDAGWPDPDFFGASLPITRPDSKRGGFAAAWQVLEYNRSFPNVWSGSGLDGDALDQSAFGARLYQSADVYQQNERSTKYGMLFIALTFGVFFLFETLKRLRVHPVQYLLIGTALATFYLLLLAASEHISFAFAYLLGAAALVLIIVGYCSAVLRSFKRALGIGAWLGLLYGVLYVLITREDFALVMGASIILLLISLTMYLTRRVDWYNMAPTADVARSAEMPPGPAE